VSVAKPIDATLASIALKHRHVSTARSKSNGRLLASDASDAEATSVFHCDRRGTESSKPRSRPTDASDGRPTDAILHLS
jgi:hypothetical protein